MSTPDVRRILDDLSECRRYAASNPSEAARLAGIVMTAIARQDFGHIGMRLIQNLGVATCFVRSNPDMIKGYCTGTIVEIQDWEANNR